MNLVVIKGRFAADPELKRTPSDIAVTSFDLAVPRGYGDKKSVDWISFVAWRQTAEFIAKYFEKGQEILVTGSIQTRTYEDKSGNKRKAVEVLVDRAEFCESKNSTSTENRSNGFELSSFVSGSDDEFSVLSADDDLPW